MANDSLNTPDAAAPEATAPKKRAVSKREVLGYENDAVIVQPDWLDAIGVRYTTLSSGFALDVIFADLPDAVQRGLMAFGALTLAGNVTNTVRNSEDGKAASEDDIAVAERDALTTWLDTLRAGNWSSARGEVEAGTSALTEAYIRAQAKLGKTYEFDAIKIKMDGKTKEERAALRKDPRIAAALAEIALERKQAKAAEQAGDMPEL